MENNILHEHYAFIVDKGQSPIRIDKYLMNFIENTTRNKIQSAVKKGCVIVNGKHVKSNYNVKPEDNIKVVFDYPPSENLIIAEDIQLNIVYEDNDFAMASLSSQFAEKKTSREYFALVWGEVKNEKQKIVNHIGRNPKNRLQNIVLDAENENLGKLAITNYELVERLGYVSLIKCKLETGRTHQIRVHMKHIGHTLFNDERYGGNSILKGTSFTKYKQFVDNCFKILPRQALHAYSLGFYHPTTQKFVEFMSELPDDFSSCLKKWRSYSKNSMAS